MAGRKTLLRDKDIAAPGVGYTGVQSDKITDGVPNNNKFLTAAQKDILTGGQKADALHWHAGFGAISAQFGRYGLTAQGQYIDVNGVPSNLVGIPLANDGQLLSIAASVSEPVVGQDVIITIKAPLYLGHVTIPIGSRKGFARNLAADFVAETELKCQLTQGQANMPSVFVEFRWR